MVWKTFAFSGARLGGASTPNQACLVLADTALATSPCCGFSPVGYETIARRSSVDASNWTCAISSNGKPIRSISRSTEPASSAS